MTTNSTYQLVVHGGAGSWSESDHSGVRAGLRDALGEGRRILEERDSALDAVVGAVASMEDNPMFNAGTGSCLTWEGEAEMDASVMMGGERRAGAVAHVKGIKNPVQLAREVMEHTDHVILGGEGARRFARLRGFDEYDPITDRARERLSRMKQSLREGRGGEWPRTAELLKAHPEWLSGTVGAVARDATGQLAAATSTGGRVGKLPGRIGDTPVPGAGTLATNRAAASATGNGELILRFLITARYAQFVERGCSAPVAARRTMEERGPEQREQMGLIGIDRAGSIGIEHGSQNMPHGWIETGQSTPTIRMAVPDEHGPR